MRQRVPLPVPRSPGAVRGPPGLCCGFSGLAQACSTHAGGAGLARVTPCPARGAWTGSELPAEHRDLGICRRWCEASLGQVYKPLRHCLVRISRCDVTEQSRPGDRAVTLEPQSQSHCQHSGEQRSTALGRERQVPGPGPGDPGVTADVIIAICGTLSYP